MITLSLPFPPTTNNLFLQRGRMRILAPAYRKWRTLVEPMVHEQMRGQTPLKGAYIMHIALDRPDKRARDVSNYAKALEDSLVNCGVVRDDSDCIRLVLHWSQRASGKGAMAVVKIEEENEF